MSRLEGHIEIIQISTVLYVVICPPVVHEMIWGDHRCTLFILMCIKKYI